MPDQPQFAYRLFGLRILSQIALPELHPAPADAGAAADVAIELGGVALPEGVSPVEGWYAIGGDGVLRVKGVARYAVSDGSRIVIDCETDALDRNVRLFLLGTAFGVLLHQRRIVPLHANAIDLDGRAIGFLGRSGIGKSTLAAAFHDQGWRVLSDDVCAVTAADEGFLAQPGIPRLRLWRDAIERTGRTVEGHERAFNQADKFTVAIPGEAGGAVPLAALYLLAEKSGEDFAIARLSGASAVTALLANTYRGGLVRHAGDTRQHFETCVAIARRIPLFELTRPWDGARIGETVGRVAEHLATFG